MRTRTARDIAAALDPLLQEDGRDEPARPPAPREVPNTKLRAPMTDAEPAARAAPELRVERPSVIDFDRADPEPVDRHAAIAKALEQWRAAPRHDEALERVEPDNDADDLGDKPKDPLVVGADVTTENDEDAETRGRLNIARRIGGIAQAVGGIIGIVNGARYGASDAGIGGFAASQALMGVGGGMAEGAERHVGELDAEARQRREQANAAATRERAAAQMLDQSKHLSRLDEAQAARDEVTAMDREADNARMAAELAHQMELDDAKLGIEQQRADSYEFQAHNMRRRGGGGAGGAPRGPSQTPDWMQPLADPMMEAEARRFALQSVPAGQEPEPLVMAVNRRRVYTHHTNVPRMHPGEQDRAEGNYSTAIGAALGGTNATREIMAARQQQRELVPLEEQGFTLTPGASIPTPAARAEVTQHWNATRILAGQIKRATDLAGQLSPQQIALIAQGRLEEAGPQATDLISSLNEINTLYRRYADFGTPQKAEFERIEAMFPPPGANWSTLTGSNIAMLRSSGNTILNLGLQELNGLGFRRGAAQ